MPAETKRPGGELVAVPEKKLRTEIVAAGNSSLQQTGYSRTSNLSAPIMLLTGHEGDIFTAKFHPDGDFLASAGFERRIYFWNVYGESDNFAVLSGHSGSIMELHFSTDGAAIFTASTDKSVGIWDTSSGKLVKRLKGHTTFVNACHPARRGPQLVVSGSDDSTIKIWDTRKKQPVLSMNNVYQVTSVTFNDTAEQVISGGIDNDVKIWDIRKCALLNRLKGHTDTVTGLTLSPDGSYVLSNAMDNTLRVWDVRPFAPAERCLKIMSGHQHNFEKNLLRCCWSPDGSMVSGGSADRFVYIWDTTSRRILYKLPGHNASVNDISFHNKEPIILSASSDKQIFLGEIEAR